MNDNKKQIEPVPNDITHLKFDENVDLVRKLSLAVDLLRYVRVKVSDLPNKGKLGGHKVT